MASPVKWYVECYHVTPLPRYLTSSQRTRYLTSSQRKYKTDKGMLAHMSKCEQKRHNIIHLKPRPMTVEVNNG